MSDSVVLDDPATNIGGARCHLYVFPCVWEDHCKVGFSRDPLARMQALHRRYFEFFDLDHGYLVETETTRDARNLELELRRLLVAHNAPAPSTIRPQAGGHTEWYRGAEAALDAAMGTLHARDYPVHAPLRPWLKAAWFDRIGLLYSWTRAQLFPFDLAEDAGVPPPVASLVCDALDAAAAFGVDLQAVLSPDIERWYRLHAGHPAWEVPGSARPAHA